MSKSANALFSSDKDFLAQLRSNTTVLANGKLLGNKSKDEENDRDTVIDAVFYQYLFLSDLSSTIGASQLDLREWAIYVVRHDIALIVEVMKEVFQYCAEYDNTAQVVEYTSFKHLFPSVSTEEFDAIFSPLSDVLSNFLKYQDPMDFSTINSYCNFLGRLNLPSLDYTEECIKSYESVEKHIAGVIPSSRTLEELNLIIREWMTDFCVVDLHPQHSSGGVAHLGRCSVYDKYKSFWTDARLDYFLADFPNWNACCKPFLLENSRGIPLRRVAELRVVAKSITKNRTICMEDCTLQYFQKGIARELMKFVRSRHAPSSRVRNLARYAKVYAGRDFPKASLDVLRDHTNFFDQEPNRLWSAEGSRDGSYATVDLSNASDTVSLKLVKTLFQGTRLLKYIVCTRSDAYLLPDGTIKKFSKVYPSGSAMCFPIEDIVFASICELAVRRSGIDRTHNEFRVFGDDIVIKPHFIGDLFAILDELGFIINSSKSYWMGKFRESCGGEYYNGTNVTPLRISRKYKHLSREDCPGAIDNRIEFANRCALYGYRRLRQFLISDLFEGIRKFYPSSSRPNLPLMIDDMSFLYSSTPTNFHLSKSYNVELQCEDIHYGATHSREDALGRGYNKSFLKYKAELRAYNDVVRTLLLRGYVLPDSKSAQPLEALPQDYDEYRYQLWIDLSSAKAMGNLDFLRPDHSVASIRTRTDYFGKAVYHNS